MFSFTRRFWRTIARKIRTHSTRRIRANRRTLLRAARHLIARRFHGGIPPQWRHGVANPHPGWLGGLLRDGNWRTERDRQHLALRVLRGTTEAQGSTGRRAGLAGVSGRGSTHDQVHEQPAHDPVALSAPPPSSLERLLRVIDLFTPEQPQWTADRIGEVMAVSRATQYRYIKNLMNAGLLASAGEGRYRLGPRFVVLDRQIRLSDPLSRHGPAIMQRACAELGSAQLLCTHFADEVLCIHQERVDDRIRSSMERGRPFPMFRGSPSRAILAWLPESRLRNLMLLHAHEIREAGLGGTR
ncbi:MAG: hypothetical protein EOP39_25150, partial [Rubrivivax sp.]